VERISKMVGKVNRNEDVQRIEPEQKEIIKDPFKEQVTDMDSFAKQVYSSMPQLSTEMIYRITLDTNSKIYAIIGFVGLLMIIVILITTI